MQYRSTQHRSRAVVFITAAAALLAGLTVDVPAGAAVSSVVPASTSIVAPVDYFTNQWNDPLDFSNAEDISLTRLHLSQGTPSMTGGKLTVANASQIIIARGDPGALPTSAVHDPRARTLDGNVFTRFTFRMHSDRAAAGAIGFRSCDSCNDGYRYFDVVPGWHTYDFDMVGSADLEGWPGGTSRFAGPSWGGSIGLLYLSLAFNVPTKPTVTLDDARVYAPTSPVNVTLSGGSGTVELWQDTNGNTADDGASSPGPGESANRIGTFAAGSTVSIPQGLFRPDTPVRFYTSQSGTRGAASAAVTMASTSTPSPVVMTPSELGGTDFATEVRGDPWEFDQQSDVQKTFNTDASVHDGALFGWAAGTRNDPVVLFNVGSRAIDATLYHKVAVTMNFDGPWGLEDAPDGGMVGRFVWQGTGGQHEQVSMPIVVKPGRATYVVSFRSNPPTAILDPTGNIDWIGWGTGAATFLNMFRFDPHEDPGNRSWQIDDVKLLRDESVSPTFDIQFRDDTWAAGTTADIYVDGNRNVMDGLGTLIAGTVGVTQGTNTYTWNGGGVAAGAYYVHIVMHRGGRNISASSTGQVDVGMNGSGAPPALNVEPPGPTQAQILAFFTFLMQAKFFCAVARNQGNAAAGGASLCVQLLGPMPKAKAKARAKARRRR